MERHLNKLVSPGFLVGLTALLLNDFVLKQQFHDGLTGKLSDFAGLFIFPLFWAAFFPRRRFFIYVLTAAAFVVWKSPYSQPLIESWNSLPFVSIGRTVDYSDLLALVALPLSYAYSRIPSGIPSPRSAIYLMAVVSMFAFIATSFSTKTAYDNEYVFQNSKKELLERIRRLASHDISSSFWDSDTFEISFDSCIGRATVNIHEKDKQSAITLKEIDYRCPSPEDKEKMREYFEKQFINKLREEPVTRSAQVEYVWSSVTNNNSGATRPKPDSQSVSPFVEGAPGKK